MHQKNSRPLSIELPRRIYEASVVRTKENHGLEHLLDRGWGLFIGNRYTFWDSGSILVAGDKRRPLTKLKVLDLPLSNFRNLSFRHGQSKSGKLGSVSDFLSVSSASYKSIPASSSLDG